MSYIKTAVDSGSSIASVAFKPFHNFLVNNFRLVCINPKNVFFDVEYLQIYFVIGGKVNLITSSSIGDVEKIRGKKAYSIELFVANEDWMGKNFNDFKDLIIDLLKSGLSKIEIELTSLNKLRKSNVFCQETSVVLDKLAELSTSNLDENLTLVEEALKKSHLYWSNKEK